MVQNFFLCSYPVPIIRKRYSHAGEKRGLSRSSPFAIETRHREQVPIYHVAVQACVEYMCARVVCMSIRVRTHLVVLHDGSGLSLGGHIQFSGVPSLPPFAEREISASPVSIRLSASVLLSPPVSLSFALPSVFFLLLASHKRPPEGTATITRNTKAGENGAGVDNDRRAHAVMNVALLLFPSVPSSFPLLSPFFASA